MKNTPLIALLLLLLFGCKKEETTYSSNKYDVTFTASKSASKLTIVFNHADGSIDTQYLSSTGLTYAYNSIKNGTQLFCTALIDTPNTGYFKCTWAIKDEVKKVDSVWMDENTRIFTSQFNF